MYNHPVSQRRTSDAAPSTNPQENQSGSHGGHALTQERLSNAFGDLETQNDPSDVFGKGYMGGGGRYGQESALRQVRVSTQYDHSILTNASVAII